MGDAAFDFGCGASDIPTYDKTRAFLCALRTFDLAVVVCFVYGYIEEEEDHKEVNTFSEMKSARSISSIYIQTAAVGSDAFRIFSFCALLIVWQTSKQATTGDRS